MSDFLKRLNEVIDKEANGKHTVFARKAGIPPSTFQAYLKGRLPHAEHLIRIHETFSISIDWLLTGTGPTYSPYASNGANIVSTPDLEFKPSVQAPLLREIIQSVEKIIKQDKKWRLSTDKKAEAISTLYDLFANSDKKVAPKAVKRILAKKPETR